jgi:uncharacterized delta-60 repeat protein
MRKKLYLLFYLLPSLTVAQINASWETTINGTGDFGDQLHSVVSDANNNIYAVGSTVNPNTDRDWLIIKYNSQSQVQWRKIFSAPGGGPDEAKKVLIHPNGNIVVTGYGNNKFVGNDFWTMMLSPSGDTLWTDLYNSPTTNLYDEPNGMVIDSQGNIIITGESDQDPSAFLNNDFLTVKYSATGALSWAVRYNAQSNDNDRSMAVAVDASNNIYITGRSFNGSDDDIITIKYNGSGTQQWIKNLDNGGIDRPVAIGIDNQTRVYVAARSDNGTDDDYRLLQYNAQGTLSFNVSYDYAGQDRPIDMVVLPAGGCIVTGRSDGNPATGINYDVHTVSFSATGTQNWVGIYNGQGNNDDIPVHLALAADGKVAVTGFTDKDATLIISNDAFLLTYSTTGASLITQTFNGTSNKDDEGHDVCFNSSGNAVVVGFTSDAGFQRNALLLNYSGNSAPTSQQIWSGWGDNGQNIRDIEIDNSGNVYYCGYNVNKDTNRDFFIGKVNSSGVAQWSADTTGTLFGSDEEANALAIDGSGNIIVSGYLKNAGTSSDVYVEKYNASGVLVWNFGYDSPIHESDRSYDMTLDNSGNIYLCGKMDADATWQVNDEIWTAKVNSNGILAWSATYASSTLLDKAQFIRLNSANEVFVAGKLQNGTNDNIIVIKYNNSGVQQWTKILDFHQGNDKLNHMEIDGNGNVILCGQTQLSAGGNDFDAFICKINAQGQQDWVQYQGNSGIGLDEAISFRIANDNSIWLTGNLDSDVTAAEMLQVYLQHYSATGNALIPSPNTFASSGSAAADDIVLNGFNEPCIGIHTNTAGTNDLDYEMQFLIWNNNALEAAYTRSVSDSIDVANLLKFSNGALYAGGSSWITNNQRDALIGKYNWIAIGVDQKTAFKTLVYPNPTSEIIHIQSEQPIAKIDIYDQQGKWIEQILPQGNGQQVSFACEQWNAGMYFISINGSKSATPIQVIKN